MKNTSKFNLIKSTLVFLSIIQISAIMPINMVPMNMAPMNMMSMEVRDQKKLFSGSIEFPFQMDFDLCLFYKGEKLTIEKQASAPFVEFSFLDTKETQTIYFIISLGITCCTEIANTLQSLQIMPEYQYICYKLQATRELDADEHMLLSWEIKEHTLDKNIVPQNSLIFLFNPKLIAGLKIQSWKPENVFRIVPTVLINPRTTMQELDRAMTIARLVALDLDSLHTKTTPPTPTTAILTAMQ